MYRRSKTSYTFWLPTLWRLSAKGNMLTFTWTFWLCSLPKERIFPKMVLKLLLRGPRSNSELAAFLHLSPALPQAISKQHSSWQNRTLYLFPQCAVPSLHLHSTLN
jgi:hypothetical protein